MWLAEGRRDVTSSLSKNRLSWGSCIVWDVKTLGRYNYGKYDSVSLLRDFGYKFLGDFKFCMSKIPRVGLRSLWTEESLVVAPAPR